MKHAYLIMAANEFEELLVLLKALDYEDNAIFLHIDKKAALSSLQLKRFKQQVSKADFYLAPRKKVSWGGRDMLECEFSLFSFARSVGPFDYYHLLSARTCRVLSHKRIDEFFEKNKGQGIRRVQTDQRSGSLAKSSGLACISERFGISFGQKRSVETDDSCLSQA